MTPADVGARLRRAGLTQPALLAWAGTHRVSALSSIAADLAARPVVPAAAVLALLVGGVELSIDRVRALPIDELVALGLVERAADRVRATVAILPLEHTLVVCDRADAPASHHLVCWPDDSSYHLASAIPAGRRPRWLDLATGSAFAPLARPALASSITGIDLNDRAVAFARFGAQLSGTTQIELACADIGDVHQTAELVTCNAPILGDSDPAMWRATDRAFFDRMWRTARACVAPGGEVIVHCVLDGVPADLDGDVTSVVYTPPGERAYAVTWWRPDAAPRRVIGHRELTLARPHLEARDRDDARTG